MPFLSRAQWAKCFASKKPGWDCRKWANETPGGKGTRFRRLPTKVTTKAQTAEEKAMFAKMGGSGGGGGGGKGGHSRLWPRDSKTGKRSPTKSYVDGLRSKVHTLFEQEVNVSSEIRKKTDQQAKLRSHAAWGQTLKPKYRKQNEAEHAKLESEIKDLRAKRTSIQHESDHLNTLANRAEKRLTSTTKDYSAKAGQQIAGNLYRGADGKFHAGGSADDQAKATIAQNKKLNAAAPKGKGKGGKGKKAGGKGAKPKKVKVAKPKLTPEQQHAEKLAKQQANRDAVKKAMMDADAALSPTGFDNVMKLASGQQLDPKTSDDLVKLGMARKRKDGSYAMTPSAHAFVKAASTGDAATATKIVNSAAQPTTAKSVRVVHQTPTVALPVLSATTYKSATGQRRWLFVSSTAYQDRDGETVTTKALRRAVELADQTGYRGNLRYWHLPSHLGDCDWQMVSEDGTLLYESGSFASDGIADWYESNKEQYLLSIGFRHPVSEPLPDKSFENVFIFERSLLPIQYASNVFTGKVL